ncbi:hypothetical protein CGUA_06425 [Corynebacterium guangdongense]|nr:hypothetical protein CGUA_06425 [Corynebacterium guangdongense]
MSPWARGGSARRRVALSAAATAVLFGVVGCGASDSAGGTPETLTTVSHWSETSSAATTATSSPEAATPAPTTTAPEHPPIAAGESANVEVRVGERTRTFILSVPEGYSSKQSWPVIFVFHGKGERPEHLRDYTGLDRATALVVYGQGVDDSWAPAPYATTTLDEDLDYVRATLDKVREQYHVDEEKTYATGFSNGGGFAAAVGCHMTGEFEAVAPVGAAYYKDVFKGCSKEPMPFFTIHGTADDVIHYGGGNRHETDYYSVDEVLTIMQQRNGCSGRGSITPENEAALYVSFVDCDTPLEYVRNGGGEHLWPGTGRDRNAKMPDGYATYRILEFFGVNWIWTPETR